MNAPKKWYKSKTLWLNALAAALIAIEANYSLLAPVLGPSTYGTLAVILAGLNAVLRVITTQGVTFK